MSAGFAGLDGAVALVTGGGGAIGAAAALKLAAAGAKIVVADRDRDSAAATADQIEAGGADAAVVICDVGEPAGAEKAVAAATERFGRLNVVFNNAGVRQTPAPVDQLSIEHFDEVLRVNLRGVFLILREAIRVMAPAGRGSIVNMGSSMAGWDVLARSAAYVSSKHAVVGLTQAAALDAARHGIRVNAVCPGVVETPLGVPDLDTSPASAELERLAARIPLRRVAQPEDVASMVAFLASSESRHVTGAAWLIDGGQTLQSWSNSPPGTAYPSEAIRRQER